jgi:hypothetical protein
MIFAESQSQRWSSIKLLLDSKKYARVAVVEKSDTIKGLI